MLDRFQMVVDLAKKLQLENPKSFTPPVEALKPETSQILPSDLIGNDDDQLSRLVLQINGCYENGWFDACAVMMRRMLETLLIAIFEVNGFAAEIQEPTTGDFFQLAKIIQITLNQVHWNLGRRTKQALPKLKDLGDQSAHNRRYRARRDDIEKHSFDFRIVCEELLSIAKMR
jgi:hypothetical protein